MRSVAAGMAAPQWAAGPAPPGQGRPGGRPGRGKEGVVAGSARTGLRVARAGRGNGGVRDRPRPPRPRDRAPGLMAARRPARAETVGSLLRPARLMEAAGRVYDPGHLVLYDEERARDRSELDRVAEEEIRRAVERHVAAGLDVVSDGEFRRLHFISSFHNAVQGFQSAPGRRFTNGAGDEVQVSEGHVVCDRLRKVESTLAREARFLASITDHPFKVTLPAA